MKSKNLPAGIARWNEKINKNLFVFLFIFMMSFIFNFQSKAIDLVVSTELCFSDMDNNPLYDQDIVPGEIKLNSLSIVSGGTIRNNDPYPSNPCNPVSSPASNASNIKIIVINNMSILAGGSINADDSADGGKGGDITLTIGGNFTMTGGLITSSNLVGTNPNDSGGVITIKVTGNVILENNALIKSTAPKSNGGAFHMSVDGSLTMQGNPGATIQTDNTSGNGKGGDITIHVVGPIDVQPGSTIEANSGTGQGGTIDISGDDNIHIDGHIFSVSSGSGTGPNFGHGGFISVSTTRSLFISDEGILRSRAGDPGADLIHLCGCDVTIYGLIESTGPGHAIPAAETHLFGTFRPDKPTNSTGGIEVWAYNSLLIDDLNHNGELNADIGSPGGSTGTSWIDLFVQVGDLTIIGKASGNFAVHANGTGGTNDDGGIVTVKVVTGKTTLSGQTLQASAPGNGGEGGDIVVQSKKDIDMANGLIEAAGTVGGGGGQHGGKISLRSFGTVNPDGSILANASSNLNVVGDGNDGVVNLDACGSIDFPPGTITPAIVANLAHDCGGAPDILTTQPYVVFCPCCVRTITVCKDVTFCDPAHNTGCIQKVHNWIFHSNIPGFSTFTINTVDVSGNPFHALGCRTFNNLDAGVVYTITEDLIQFEDGTGNPLSCYAPAVTCVGCSTSSDVPPSVSFNLTTCGENDSALFVNTPSCIPITDNCPWCSKGAVRSQIAQNFIDTCAIPDILVDVRLPHTPANDVVTLSELGTNIPATWSIQAAVDFVNSLPNSHVWVTPGQIFIAVTAADEGPIVTPLCGQNCARPPSGDTPFGVENVIIHNTHTERLNIFGCSVTMHAADVTKPVMTIENGVGKVTVLDIHVWNSQVAGYLINNNASLVVVKNSAAYNNYVGYDAKSGEIQLTGSQHTIGNTIGILVEGSNVKLRTMHDITNNGVGIKVTGSGNTQLTDGNEVGTNGHPNGTGVLCTGNNNYFHGDDVDYNTGNGIEVSGCGNTLSQESAQNNGGIGIKVTCASNTNKLQGNDADNNGSNGILACNQIDQGGNTGSGNSTNPQVDFACIVLGPAKFIVTDISADKSFKYDASFHLITSTLLNSNNKDANDATDDNTNTYVLDKADKQVYRYAGSTGTSKVLRILAPSTTNLNTPSGLAISGDSMWVADGNSSPKKIYKYSLSAAFNGIGTTLNALKEITLTNSGSITNTNVEGLLVDATYLYVLDKGQKKFFRYPRTGGATVASRVMKETSASGGGTLGNPMGATLDGSTVWIIDDNKDKAYSYSLADLFNGSSSALNAATQYALNGSNGSSTGIAVGAPANLYRQRQDLQQVVTESDISLQVYPNPNKGNFTIQFISNTTDQYSVNIVDITGRLVASYTEIANEGINIHEMDLHDVPVGMYLLILQNANHNEVKRIVVE